MPVTPCAVRPRPGEAERLGGGSCRAGVRLPEVQAPGRQARDPRLGAMARVKQAAALWAHWRVRPSRDVV